MDSPWPWILRSIASNIGKVKVKLSMYGTKGITVYKENKSRNLYKDHKIMMIFPYI